MADLRLLTCRYQRHRNAQPQGRKQYPNAPKVRYDELQQPQRPNRQNRPKVRCTPPPPTRVTAIFRGAQAENVFLLLLWLRLNLPRRRAVRPRALLWDRVPLPYQNVAPR